MNKIPFYILFLLLFCIGLGACKPTENNGTQTPEDLDSILPPSIPDSVAIDSIRLDSTAVLLHFGDSLSIVNPWPEKIQIQQNGMHVSIQSAGLNNMQYILSGKAGQASFRLKSDSAAILVLNGIYLQSNIGPAIYNESETLCIVHVKDSTENTLIDGDYSHDMDNRLKACLFSQGPIILDGLGRVCVSSTQRHALGSASYIRLRQGRLDLNSQAKDGLHTEGSFWMENGELQIEAFSDGIESDRGLIHVTNGKIAIETSNGDGIVASCKESEQNSSIYIDGGEIDIRHKGDAKSMGIKTEKDISISGGRLDIQLDGTASKALKCTESLYISGGKIRLHTTGSAEYDEVLSDISSAAGIKCDKNLYLSGDSTLLEILCQGDAGKGLNIGGNILIENGDIQVCTEGKRYNISSSLYSSPKAIKCDGNFSMEGGQLSISAMGGQGSDGIDAEGSILFNGGTCQVYTYDDAIKSTTDISINAGNIYANSATNDGIDAKGNIHINGGLVVSLGTGSKKGGFEADGSLNIKGGTVLAIGGKNKKPACTQYTITCAYSGNKDQYVHLQSQDGLSLMDFQLPRDYSTYLDMIFSSPDFVQGKQYELYLGGEVSQGESFHGFILNGKHSGGTRIKSFTVGSSKLISL